MARFIQYDRYQQYILPPSVDEWLPEDHLARYIVEVIDQLDLSQLTNRYSRSGSEAYHPALLLALLVYGYATGTSSPVAKSNEQRMIPWHSVSSLPTYIPITTPWPTSGRLF